MNRLWRRQLVRGRGFTMLEMIVVILLIVIIMSAVGITLARSRPTARVKRDAVATVSFLRNMWDRARASSGVLILQPNFDDGTLAYIDPRTGEYKQAEFDSGARVVGIQMNDRMVNMHSNLGRLPSSEDEAFGQVYDPEADVLFVSESRGLVRLGVVFSIYDEEQDTYSFPTLCVLNLINGRSKIVSLDEERMNTVLSDSPTDLSSLAKENGDD